MTAAQPVPATRIEARIEQLQEQYSRSLRLSRRLADVRARAETRRREIRAQRVRLNADMASRRSSLVSAEAVAAAAILDSALQVIGIGLPQLWLDYVSLGGSASPTQLRAILSGEVPLLRLDHDRLALALNERLDDAGHGHPLAYWDGTR